jgi:secretion/DNA translocation related TadE-like protein
MNQPALDDRGSASLWVVAAAALVLCAAAAITARIEAVLARHRADAAADLTALAVAGEIGVAPERRICAGGTGIAAANGALLTTCEARLDADGRTGTVRVTVTVVAVIPLVGRQRVSASARAERLPGTVVAGAKRLVVPDHLRRSVRSPPLRYGSNDAPWQTAHTRVQ